MPKDLFHTIKVLSNLPCKGIESPDEYFFLQTYNIMSVLSVHGQMVFLIL
jgi:hypothetical protein